MPQVFRRKLASSLKASPYHLGPPTAGRSALPVPLHAAQCSELVGSVYMLATVICQVPICLTWTSALWSSRQPMLTGSI